ncbi:uncharacterized protein LOC141899689 [Tubulanus polymorphus]|uniref:uncharacterized protein LOC141899689 n=1 Tax=Tubulanus polymorphus TaxID=672921 RepID=UPI003DA25094
MPEESSPVLVALKSSKKGRLVYDRNWFDSKDSVKKTLDDCTNYPPLNVNIPSYLRGGDDSSMVVTVATSDIQSFSITTKEESCKSTPKTGCHRKERNKDETDIASQKKSKVGLSDRATSPVDSMIEVYEKSCEMSIANAVKEKRKQSDQISQNIQKNIEESFKQQQLQKELENYKRLAMLEAEENQWKKEVQERQIQFKERRKQHAMQLHAKLKEAEAKQKEKDELQIRRRQEAQKRLQWILQTLLDCKKTKDELQVLLEQCPYKQHLPPNIQKAIDMVNTLNLKIEQAVVLAKSNGATEEHMNRVRELSNSVSTARINTIKAIENAVKKGKDEENLEKQKKQEEEQKKAEQLKQQKEKERAAAAAVKSTSAEGIAVLAKADVVLCVTEACHKQYNRIMKTLKENERNFADILTKPELKKFRFELQKAVNTPINSIASVSGSHLRDKLKKLVFLLGGQTVETIAGKKVSAGENPTGVPFVRDLFAKKIVKQGEEQVSSNFDTAFPIAGVVVGVWSMVPAIGDLLLGHFYMNCPYLVPYYIPKQDGQSQEDFYKSQGYRYEDGQIEKQDKFLRRMSGMMRLFAAILITMPPDSASNHPHPFGIEQSWIWLVNVINLEPRPSITATMLYDFLQVTGNVLNKTYGKQFHKLLNAIVLAYLPKIQKVTPAGSGGPVVRLESCLQKWLKSGNIPPPDGVLAPNFWYT